MLIFDIFQYFTPQCHAIQMVRDATVHAHPKLTHISPVIKCMHWFGDVH